MENEKNTVDLLDLLKYLLRKWWILLLVALLVAALAFCISYYLMTPTYTADIMLYVNNTSRTNGQNSPNISNSELSAAQSLVDTYIVILQSRKTYENVCNNSGEQFSFGAFKSMLQATAVNDTEIFSVKVTTADPTRSAKIANSIATVLPSIIADTVDGSSVRVVQYAEVPTRQSAPNYFRNTLIGMFIGLLLSALVLALYKIFDDSIRDEDYLAYAYPNIPLLSVIPDAAAGKGYGYYRKRYYKSYYGNYSQNSKKGGR